MMKELLMLKCATCSEEWPSHSRDVLCVVVVDGVLLRFECYANSGVTSVLLLYGWM